MVEEADRIPVEHDPSRPDEDLLIRASDGTWVVFHCDSVESATRLAYAIYLAVDSVEIDRGN